jgi:hypothetical protein
VGRNSQFDVVGEKGNLQILGNLLAANILRCLSRNAKTFELYQLQLPNMGAGTAPPNGAPTAHHRTNDLLINHKYEIFRCGA